MSTTPCPACVEGTLEPFFSLENTPIFCNVLWETAEEARNAPRGDILLGLCDGCGLIYNTAFDPDKVAYSPAYENSLHLSPRFERYAEALASRLTHTYGLDGKLLLEIGCGRGEFLEKLCAGGRNRGLGFDGGYGGPLTRGSMRFISDGFSPERVDGAVDFICARHVLEHVHRPRAFLEGIRAVARRGCGAAPLYLEVPNGAWILQELRVWDVIYEHCSYFTGPALRQLATRTGFLPGVPYSAFDGQFLCLEAVPEGSREPEESGGGRGLREVGEAWEARKASRPRALDPVAQSSHGTSLVSSGVSNEGPADAAVASERAGLRGLTRTFGAQCTGSMDRWRRCLEGWRTEGRQVAVWGAGSKGVMFLNAMESTGGVGWVVDINPRKQGRFVPGTGHRVVGPEALTGQHIDRVLVMNGIYRAEIMGQLEGLEVKAEVVVL